MRSKKEGRARARAERANGEECETVNPPHIKEPRTRKWFEQDIWRRAVSLLPPSLSLSLPYLNPLFFFSIARIPGKLR